MIGDVTLASGRTASYYIDARRALLRSDAFTALGEPVSAEAATLAHLPWAAQPLGADPIACSVLSVAR